MDPNGASNHSERKIVWNFPTTATIMASEPPQGGGKRKTHIFRPNTCAVHSFDGGIKHIV